MPVIHTHVSVSTTPEQREALKAAYGRAITAVPGKSEGWLMCPFEDNMPIYFGGSDDQPAAYVEVNVFGRSVPSSAWEKLTQNIMAALNSTLGVPEDRTYIRYTATTDWGWNGGNFKLLYLAPGGGVVEHSETGGEWSAMALPPSQLHCQLVRRLLAHCRLPFCYKQPHQAVCLTSQPQSEDSRHEKPAAGGLSAFQGADFQHSETLLALQGAANTRNLEYDH